MTHGWGGPIGVPRDWCASVGLDRSTGLGWAGGYVGDGVATTNLAGRTLADLVTGADSEITRLPWVGHRSPPWEPEPLRWLGVNAGPADDELGRPAGGEDRAPVPGGVGDGPVPRFLTPLPAGRGRPRGPRQDKRWPHRNETDTDALDPEQVRTEFARSRAGLLASPATPSAASSIGRAADS